LKDELSERDEDSMVMIAKGYNRSAKRFDPKKFYKKGFL